jgi:ketosteroid isomerase-like protein
MNRSKAVIVAGLLFTVSAAAPAAWTSTGSVTPRMSAEECKVWARELSFAAAIARHDAAAFAEHLEKGAAFSAESPQPLRGDAAIAKQWSRFVEGKSLLLSWYPTRVTIGGVADVASSSGPALYEDVRPGAKQHYSIGGFHSIWHRGKDGVWRILFDDGIEPKAAVEADVSSFRGGRQANCPTE